MKLPPAYPSQEGISVKGMGMEFCNNYIGLLRRNNESVRFGDNRMLFCLEKILVKDKEEEMYTFQTVEERRLLVELEGSSQRKTTRQLRRNTREEVLTDNFYQKKWSLFKQTH